MPVTICLIIANVIVFGVYVFQSSFAGLLTYDSPVLFKMGAAYGPDILFFHQYWRLVSSLFLHANLQHICLNMFSLFIFGRMLEKPMGSGRFFVLYAVSGLFGGLASLGMHRLDESVGASGAIFGLVGFYMSLQLQMDKQAHPGVSYRIRQCIGLALALYCLSLTPGVDHAAHMGGLIAGIICGGTFQRLSDLQVRWSWRDLAITAAFAALFVAGLYYEQCTIGKDSTMKAAVLLRQSVNQLQGNDLNGALSILDKSLAIDPKNEKAWLLHSDISQSLGRYDKALEDSSAALSLNPNHSKALNQRACVYLALGRYAEALADAKGAVERDDQFPEAIDTEAMAYAYLGSLDKALVAINQAIGQENGTGGIYYYHRAKIFSALGDATRAATDMEQAQKLGFVPEKWEQERPLLKSLGTAAEQP